MVERCIKDLTLDSEENEKADTKAEAIRMLKYFYEEKGDIERYTGYEEAIKYFPEIKEAWEKLKKAKRIMHLEIILAERKYDNEDN